MSKILIIEDDQAIKLGLKELLIQSDYEVITESDGVNGLQKTLSENPDLVILDIGLPSLNGFDVCKKLRELKFNNPIIMLTSKGDSIDKVVGLEIGANDYITKPFNPRELLARIRVQLRTLDIKTNAAEENILIRKLFAIMFTDMKNYSKSMHLNEVRAIKMLENHNDILKKEIPRFRGNIIEIIGDAFLASFNSAVDSVNCGLSIQKEIFRYNQTVTKKEKIRIRIGIHIGDVIEFEGKLKGDTLNIAARIQQTAKTGSVYFSDDVFSAVQNKIDFIPESVGIYKFKNINKSIEVFKVEYDEV